MEKLDQPALMALVGYGEDALAEQRMGGFLQGDIPKEGMDGRQPGIAGAGGVPAISFEMLEEPTDERRSEILEQEIRGRLIELFCRETQKQAEGVTVSG
jgi:hypothetical protein